MFTKNERKGPTPLRCKRCSHTWQYSGTNPYVATCPHCRTTVSIQKHRVSQTGQSFEGPASLVTSQPSRIVSPTMNSCSPIFGSSVFKVSKFSTDTVTECLTSDCKDCSGSYSSEILRHRFVCTCNCHNQAYNNDRDRKKKTHAHRSNLRMHRVKDQENKGEYPNHG